MRPVLGGREAIACYTPVLRGRFICPQVMANRREAIPPRQDATAMRPAARSSQNAITSSTGKAQGVGMDSKNGIRA